MGKSTISMAMFNSYVSHNQRVYRNDPISPTEIPIRFQGEGHLAMGIPGPSDFPFFSGIPGLVMTNIAMV